MTLFLSDPQSLLNLTLQGKIFRTNTEAERNIKVGAVKVNNLIVTDPEYLVRTDCVISTGKRKIPVVYFSEKPFVKVTLPDERVVSFYKFEYSPEFVGNKGGPPEVDEIQVTEAFWGDPALLRVLTQEELEDLHEDGESYQAILDALRNVDQENLLRISQQQTDPKLEEIRRERCETQVIFRLKNEPGLWKSLSFQWRGNEDRIRAYLTKKYGNNLAVILNEEVVR